MSDLFARHRAVIPTWVGVNYSEPIEIVSGKGCRVNDGQGNSYLDFFAGILTNMLGYDVAEVREAVERQIASGIYHTSTLYLIRSQVELAEKIARLSGIPNAKVFFTNSGSEANEAALAAALSARKANQVLAMRNSYHGRTFGTVAITGNTSWKASSNDPFGTHYLHGTDRDLPAYRHLSDAEYIDACVEDLRALLTAAVHPADVGALIAEPIQGVGGFTSGPDGLLAAFRRVLDRHGILWITDEVQTGWGRTGEHFWGWQAHGQAGPPDILTFAKGLGNGLSIGGVVARAEVMNCLTANSISTFGGSPVTTAGALANLNYLVEHDLQGNARRVGGLLLARLQSVAATSPLVREVRGRGLMIGVELVAPGTDEPSARAASLVLEAAREGGLLIGKGGRHGNVLRIAPPLTLTIAEAEEGAGILGSALAEAERELEGESA